MGIVEFVISTRPESQTALQGIICSIVFIQISMYYKQHLLWYTTYFHVYVYAYAYAGANLCTKVRILLRKFDLLMALKIEVLSAQINMF